MDAHFRDTASYTGITVLSDPVRRAMEAVNRADFVSPQQQACAELDSALPIDCGQTISQPFIVALMTELLQPIPSDKILEIGTGSGYQAAILSMLVSQVYSIEIIHALAESASQRLKQLAYDNISVSCGDGYHGWPEQAPFDGIMITAAIDEIPDSLVEQLVEGGRMVLPVGGQGFGQDLKVVDKQAEGITTQSVLPVRFVPFTRRQ